MMNAVNYDKCPGSFEAYEPGTVRIGDRRASGECPECRKRIGLVTLPLPGDRPNQASGPRVLGRHNVKAQPSQGAKVKHPGGLTGIVALASEADRRLRATRYMRTTTHYLSPTGLQRPVVGELIVLIGDSGWALFREPWSRV